MFGLFYKNIHADVACINFTTICFKLPDGRIMPSITFEKENIYDDIITFMNLSGLKRPTLELDPSRLLYFKNLDSMFVNFKMNKKKALHLKFDITKKEHLEYIMGIFFAHGFFIHDKNNYDNQIYIEFENKNNHFTEKMNTLIPDVLHRIAYNNVMNNPEYKELSIQERKNLLIPSLYSDLYDVYQKHWTNESVVSQS